MILKLISGLYDLEKRFEAGIQLAEFFKCSSLMIFIVDPEIGVLLPAPGFPQTLPNGGAWNAFIMQCSHKGLHSGNLPFSDPAHLLASVGMRGPENSVAIFLGGSPTEEDLQPFRDLLPLLISLFKAELANITADIRVKFADKSAVKAEKLAATIDLMRLHLKEALVKQENDKKDIEDLMKKKDEFMNVASHELKTPITSMKAYIQILKKKILPGERDLEIDFINKASKQVDKLIALVNDLLDVSKIQAGQMIYQFSEVDLAELIEDVVSQMQLGVQTHQIKIRNNAHIIVEGERQRLEQVIINFLSNAIKYSPNADEVIINTELINDQIRVSIRDFGIGVPSDKHDLIFDRFFRDQDVSQNFPGLGLGLYISADIIKRHGGSVGIESKDEGSEFYFILPKVSSKKYN